MTQLADRAVGLALAIADALAYVGVLAVEMFVVDGELLVNELAPRPHNSGHWTLDASMTSQYEQQIRAVCGLGLGRTTMTAASIAMVNLLGDVWAGGEPLWDVVLDEPRAKLHLYGKRAPRPGRKMGHLTVTSDVATEAVDRALELRAASPGRDDARTCGSSSGGAAVQEVDGRAAFVESAPFEPGHRTPARAVDHPARQAGSTRHDPFHRRRVVGDVGGQMQGAADLQPVGECTHDVASNDAAVVLTNLRPRVGEEDPHPAEGAGTDPVEEHEHVAVNDAHVRRARRRQQRRASSPHRACGPRRR